MTAVSLICSRSSSKSFFSFSESNSSESDPPFFFLLDPLLEPSSESSSSLSSFFLFVLLFCLFLIFFLFWFAFFLFLPAVVRTRFRRLRCGKFSRHFITPCFRLFFFNAFIIIIIYDKTIVFILVLT